MPQPQPDWCSRWALYSPDKIAFKEYESGRTLTFNQLNRLGNRLAHILHQDFGIDRGDRIALLLENCLELQILFVAAQKLGFILTPLNYRLAAPEIDYLLGDAEPKLVIWEPQYQDRLEAGDHFGQIPHRMPLKALQARCDPDSSQPADAAFSSRRLEEDDPIFILYTSGTTGFPKGAQYTHKMLFWNSINTAISLLVNTESRTVNCMPPFHTGGWNVLTTPFLHHGGYTCQMKKFDPAAVLRLLQEERVTIFMGVPTMLKMIAEEPGFESADFSHLYYIIVGGEPMPAPLIERWHARGVFIRQGYGMTEVGPNLTSLHQNDAIRKRGSIGRPNFYVQTKIVDEAGEEVPANQPGELLLQGPMVTPGYWRNEAATEKAIRHGWFHTGDIVLRDEEEYLYVVDRIKNMFISGGENVYPAEVERVLLTHPDITAAAVAPMPDEKWGEVGKAFVVVKPERTLDTQAVQAHCRAHLAKFKAPREVVFLEELPKNDVGKVDRKKLMDF